jgi:anti-anti-sigma factor
VQEGGHPGIAVTRETPGVACVVLTGEHDRYTARLLTQTLAEELDALRSVVVDLGGASFLDSTNAGALLVANELAAKRGGRFVVLLPEEAGWAVRRLFETSRLDTILTVLDTRDAALEAVQKPGE